MTNLTAVQVIKELEKFNLNNTKIIVMLDNEKKSIKEHYLKDYNFVDYLLKKDYRKEIKRIKEKY